MPLPVITQGGEEIQNNTYGFEVEFCSHDNSVFAFTHVDTALISIQGQGINIIWRIETDSGNVLELVTSPINFPTVADAYQFKGRLTLELTGSVNQARTYQEWSQNILIALTPLATELYGPCRLGFLFETYANVNPQINVNNIDDGINIQAALVRMNRNQATWNNYVGATVLSRSQKDWLSGYSSQVNMPMTASGYFMYSIGKKFAKALQRFATIVDQPETLNAIETDKLEKHVWYWFWLNVEFAAFVMYARRIWGPEIYGFIHALLPEQRAPFLDELEHLPVNDDDLRVGVQTYMNVTSIVKNVYAANRLQLNEEIVTRLAVLYITVCKMLTGALGSLSEQNQLALQQIAWDRGSTEAMLPPPDEANEIMAMRRWLEYHSSMKDLSSLWFKGALLDVNYRQQIYMRLQNDHAAHEFLPEGWAGIIGSFVSVLNSERWNTGRVYTDALDDLEFNVLAQRIHNVENQYNVLTANWGDVVPPFVLPPRNQRPFLQYGTSPDSAWEGRYDTMIPAIPPHDNMQSYTYLIEHRNN